MKESVPEWIHMHDKLVSIMCFSCGGSFEDLGTRVAEFSWDWRLSEEVTAKKFIQT